MAIGTAAVLRRIDLIKKRAFGLAAKYHSPQAAAWLLYLTSKTSLAKSQKTKQGGRRYRMLALSVNKAGFQQDIEESFAEEFDIVYWPIFALRIFADTILSPELHNNKHYLSDDPKIETTKSEYRDFLRQTWKHLLNIMPLHVVVSPNYGYYIQREFAAALEESGTPFIVLHKENLKSPGRLEYWRAVYEARRGRFSGRKILVYNDIERDLQVTTGVTDPEKVIVTGMPRLDRIHKWRLQRARIEHTIGQPQVLFFAFDKSDKLPASRGSSIPEIDRRWGSLSWGTLCEKTHAAIANLARLRPDLRVIVKTKSIARHQEDIVRMLRQNDGPLPANLEVVCGGDSFQLLAESNVVVGFNTTAQLEAMAAGIPVIVPWFDEAIDPKTRDFVIELGNSVEYANSPEEIIKLVCGHIDHPKKPHEELTPEVQSALRTWTSNNDGNSRRRVLDAVYRELNEDLAVRK